MSSHVKMIGIYENFIFKYTQNVPGVASAKPGTFFITEPQDLITSILPTSNLNQNILQRYTLFLAESRSRVKMYIGEAKCEGVLGVKSGIFCNFTR